ncbi:pH-response regulator protein palA/rim20 [Tulasnella sp. 418]|nr:pH-response regulator protein palA/rim20 [Tulasnella sp. 418]
MKQYIKQHHPDTHPDAFKWDISRWESIRKDSIAETIHISKPPTLLLYHAQLVFILTKLPPDIDLEITYEPIFPKTNARSLTLKNLHYERVGVLCNVASLYCQLANQEDRTTTPGTKQALNYYQLSAGTLLYLVDSVLPTMQRTAGISLPSDQSLPFFRSLHLLMLAQAQECAWQKARMDNMKNTIISRLSMKTSMLYGSVISTIENAHPPISGMFSPEWLAHIKTKQQHFQAVAQYRKSMDERYGDAIARLTAALNHAKKAEEFSKQSRYVNKAVQDDVKGLLVNIQRDLDSANRDNDLIYHKDIPSLGSLPAITPADLAVASIPRELMDPAWCLSSASEQPLFGDLLAYGARVAIELYEDRRSNWIKEEITDRRRSLDKDASATLQELHLPASLEALNRVIGLPPSLLKKSEEIRRDGGTERVLTLITDVQRLADQDRTLLEESLDILDQEAEDDESFRDMFMKTGGPLERLPSHLANKDFTDKILRYREAVAKALESDRIVRSHWEQWRSTVELLCKDPAELEKFVPTSSRSNSSQGSVTQSRARTLRELLEKLDDTRNQRDQIVNKVSRMALSDSIQKRIAREATGIERWTEVKPEMFEDAISEELAKYETFKEELDINESEQDDILHSIRAANEAFLQSRREDSSIKERQQVLQSLDDAYHHYHEVANHLCEGLEFYNKLATVLIDLKESVKRWVDGRNQEVKWVTEAFDKMEIGSEIEPSGHIANRVTPVNDPYSGQFLSHPASADQLPSQQTGAIANLVTPVGASSQSRSMTAQAPMAAAVGSSGRSDREKIPFPAQDTGFNSSQSSQEPIASPWRSQKYDYNLSSANWEEEEIPQRTPPKPKSKAKIIDRKLANAEWEDDDMPSSKSKLKDTGKARTETPARSRTRGERSRIPG